MRLSYQQTKFWKIKLQRLQDHRRNVALFARQQLKLVLRKLKSSKIMPKIDEKDEAIFND